LIYFYTQPFGIPMKKYVYLILLVLISIACDSKKVVDFETLPNPAKLYIQKHFSTEDYKRVVKDRDSALPTFEVLLFNEYILRFDHAGNCLQVKGNELIPIPKSVIPVKIDQYINEYYFNTTVIAWAKNATQQIITLSSRVVIYFNLNGDFIKSETIPFDAEIPTLPY
jgi:hypothetical protein